jgi:hypothetical protein
LLNHRAALCDNADQEQHEENKEQNLGNPRCTCRDATEAEYRGKNRDD